MSERNPVIDPRPGDELRGDPWRYRVARNEASRVTYERYLINWGYMDTRSASLPGWRDMAASLTVEKVA